MLLVFVLETERGTKAKKKHLRKVVPVGYRENKGRRIPESILWLRHRGI